MRVSIRWFALFTFIAVAALGLWSAPRLNPALAAAAGKEAPPPGPGKAQSQSIEVSKPQRETMARTLNVPATIEAVEATDLYAKASGYIADVRVDIGARQVLAVIDVPEMQNDLAEARAQKEAKVAAAKAAEAGRKAAEATRRAANSTLKAADAHILQSQKALDVARKQKERYAAELALKDTTFKRTTRRPSPTRNWTRLRRSNWRRARTLPSRMPKSAPRKPMSLAWKPRGRWRALRLGRWTRKWTPQPLKPTPQSRRPPWRMNRSRRLKRC